MKRPVRDPKNGTYKIKGKKYKELFGSREQVWNGNAYKTPGGLTRDKLFYTKRGRIVSKKKHFSAKKDKRLEKAGYFTKKGQFGYVKKSPKGKTRKARK